MDAEGPQLYGRLRLYPGPLARARRSESCRGELGRAHISGPSVPCLPDMIGRGAQHPREAGTAELALKGSAPLGTDSAAPEGRLNLRCQHGAGGPSDSTVSEAACDPSADRYPAQNKVTPLPAVRCGGAGLGNGPSDRCRRPRQTHSDGTLPTIRHGGAGLGSGAKNGPCGISAVRRVDTLSAILHGGAGLSSGPCDGSGLAWRGPT
jgi:hypothetical protein